MGLFHVPNTSALSCGPGVGLSSYLAHTGTRKRLWIKADAEHIAEIIKMLLGGQRQKKMLLD